jgi:phosphotransferase system HPr (HPr) family protein
MAITICVTVVNEVGLHARPASLLVKEANKYEADIQIRNQTTDSGWQDAKSILGVLSLGVEKGHIVEMVVKGTDEVVAATELETLIETDFAGKL